MPGGVVYLDVDDEITSAASRVRDVQGRRVALVLPHGSRVATSRINFRLLSRDALINEKQLAVVAADSGTRALAASAGLPVYASVGDYEASQVAAAPADAPGRARRPAKAKTAAASTDGPRSESPKREDASVTAVPPPRPPVSDATRGATGGSPSPEVSRFESQAERSKPSPREDRPWGEPGSPSRAPDGPFVRARPGSRSGSRLPILIILAAIGLGLLAGGVGAYLVLPSAMIVVTPRAESLVPVEITITADPAVKEPDAAARVVPAEVLSLEVTANDAFPATGKRVEESAAKGTIRFSNLDFLRSNTVAAGSVVSTNAGVRFRTVATVTVPRAGLVGLTVFPGRISVNVTAVEPGTAGNVEPNTIVIVPKGEDPQALKVVNPDATSGGTHEESPQVVQKDVDAAVDQLTKALRTDFEARLADPSIAAPGMTVFTQTASLGDAAPTVDPSTLVGQEVETFELGMGATGTVVAVDPGPVTDIASELIRAAVEPDHDLVAGSIRVEVGAPVVDGQSVTFAATATGKQVAVLDPGKLRGLVLGKSLADARSILAPFGDVQLTAWPDWVGSVPTIADRVDVRVEQAVPVETTTPTALPT